MIRISRTTMRRLSPRAMVVSGAALGLIAGATVYGAVSSSAEPASHTAFTAPKAPVTNAAHLANCKTGAKLDKGVCVVHITKTVVKTASAAEKAELAKAPGANSSNTLKEAGEKAEQKTVAEAKATEGSVVPKVSAPVVIPSTVPTKAPVVIPATVPTKAPVPTPRPTSIPKEIAVPAPSAAS